MRFPVKKYHGIEHRLRCYRLEKHTEFTADEYNGRYQICRYKGQDFAASILALANLRNADKAEFRRLY